MSVKINPALLNAEQRKIWEAAYLQGVEEAEQKMADQEEDEQLPPAPDDVALAIIQGLAASGKYEPDNLQALVGSAWAAVPYFYVERENYATVIAPMFFKTIDVGSDDLITIVTPHLGDEETAV